jgi:beta-xylosidase
MKKLTLLLAMLILTGLSMAAAPAEQAPGSEKVYLFSYFKGNGDGLHLAWSPDGFNWKTLGNDQIYLKPEIGSKLMRDPCICRGPDGTFHMVWTTGWWDKCIGLAHSKDLVNWSPQQRLGVMDHEPNALNCWAPEILYDPASEQYMIYWSTTIPGRFPETDETGDVSREGYKQNHRIYYITTKDFETFSKTALLYDGGFNSIDATIVRDGGRWLMFVKDETKRPTAKKNLRRAVSENLTGPYGPASKPFTPDWVEGPTVLKIDEHWVVYYDEYTRHYFGAIRSKDLQTWEAINDKIRFPEGIRHGTAFEATPEILTLLMKISSGL